MPKIRLEKLTKSYGTFKVLHGINLEIEENEFTVLVGPSGCGKSTTLRMIAGLETVTSGEIYFDNNPISHLEPKDRNLAMVFQDYALYPHMDVARNISFALRLQKLPKAEIEAKVKQVAETVGLTNFLSRKPGALSGGQRQRVAMARALAKDSEVFLFDEPLSNLDAKLRGQMRAELAVMRQSVKKNMIYVTHDQIEAMTLADRIVVMNDGYIQQQGTPEMLFKKPANKFVAGFLGSPPMNFMDARIVEENDVLFAEGKEFKIAIPKKKVKSLKKHKGRVSIGIRPSDLIYDPKATSDGALDLRIVVSEYVGAQSVLMCACGNSDITVELKSETPIALGETLRFAVRSEGIHIFDGKTELAL
jgi:multiple sugar transport system ATP-binding protein|tara:strand:+ start:4987 stop:6072 length:1086 start_codon:yes stop_codon:yes gene_type:complete